MKKILYIYNFVFQRFTSLVNFPDDTWKKIDEENSHKKLFNLFFYPLFLLAILLIFTGKIAVFKPINLLNITFETLFTATAFACAFFACKIVCRETAKSFYQTQLSDIQLNKIVVYAFSVVLTVKAIASVLHFPFLYVFLLYVGFIFWKVCDTIFKLQDNGKGREKFIIINSLSVICMPLIMEYLLYLFV
jgi:hypothetical protein